MKIETRTFKVYKFDELSKQSQDHAIACEIDFMINTYDSQNMDYGDNFKKAVEKSESMRTPWFVGEYILDYCRDEIIETIKLNDYDFNDDGSMFNL